MTPPTVSYSIIQIRNAKRAASTKTRFLLAHILVAVVAAISIAPLPASADLELVMVEQNGCFYCAQWHEEVGDAYAQTPEGRIAPLRQVQLSEPTPDDLEIARRAVYTPTFILVSDGSEVGRIEGYPGEDFFWGLLGRMIETTGVELETEADHVTN